MVKRKILVGTIDNVKKLCATAMNSEYDIDLVSGRYVIDAKSIMGIFSLDLSKVIEIHVHTEDEAGANAFFEQLGGMIQ